MYNAWLSKVLTQDEHFLLKISSYDFFNLPVKMNFLKIILFMKQNKCKQKLVKSFYFLWLYVIKCSFKNIVWCYLIALDVPVSILRYTSGSIIQPPGGKGLSITNYGICIPFIKKRTGIRLVKKSLFEYSTLKIRLLTRHSISLSRKYSASWLINAKRNICLNQ